MKNNEKNCVEEFNVLMNSILDLEQQIDGLVGVKNKAQLMDAIEKVSQTAWYLKQTLFITPFINFIYGKITSVDQFYLAQSFLYDSFAIQNLGGLPYNDYEIYRMFCYEDDKTFCLISIDDQRKTKPREKNGKCKIPLRIGKLPEELSVKYLRQEQRSFFKKHLPEVFKRFKRSTK